MIALQEQVDEYKRRDEVCERKWSSLIQDCDQARAEVNDLKAQLAKQRDTFRMMATVTEHKLVEANLAIS